MRSGQKWVIGLLALGACAGLFAVTYWKRPENSVRWSFTQIHTSLVRGKREAAIRFLAPRVTWEGRERSAADFLTAYTLPAKASDIEAAACPSTSPTSASFPMAASPSTSATSSSSAGRTPPPIARA